jgi:hypothetical protein
MPDDPAGPANLALANLSIIRAGGVYPEAVCDPLGNGIVYKIKRDSNGDPVTQWGKALLQTGNPILKHG